MMRLLWVAAGRLLNIHAISQLLHGQRPCDSCSRAVRMSHESTISIRFLFWLTCVLKIVFAARSVRGLHAVPVGDCAMPPTACLRATVLRFFFCFFFSKLYFCLLNKIVDAAEAVNPHENLTAASCLRTETHRKRNTDRIRTP